MNAIFGSGPKFPEVLHPEISTLSEGERIVFAKFFFADGRLESDPC